MYHFRFSTTQRELQFVEKPEAATVPDTDVVTHDRHSRIGVAQTIHVVHVEIAAYFDGGIVEFRQASFIGKPTSQSQIIFDDVAKHGAHFECVAYTVHVFDDEELVVVVAIFGIGYGITYYPLSFGYESI